MSRLCMIFTTLRWCHWIGRHQVIASAVGSLSPTWETRIGFPVSNFSPVQTWLLWASMKWTCGLGNFCFSVSSILCLCPFNLWVNKCSQQRVRNLRNGKENLDWNKKMEGKQRLDVRAHCTHSFWGLRWVSADFSMLVLNLIERQR